RSTVTGTETTRSMARSEPSSSWRGSRPPSAWPSAQATAALVVAMAVAPASCQRRALAASQALGSNSGTSVSWRATNWAWGESVMDDSVAMSNSGLCRSGGSRDLPFAPPRRQRRTSKRCRRSAANRGNRLPRSPVAAGGGSARQRSRLPPLLRGGGGASGGSEQVGGRACAFECQQELLGRQPAAEAGQRAVGADHAVAGEHDRDR